MAGARLGVCISSRPESLLWGRVSAAGLETPCRRLLSQALAARGGKCPALAGVRWLLLGLPSPVGSVFVVWGYFSLNWRRKDWTLLGFFPLQWIWERIRGWEGGSMTCSRGCPASAPSPQPASWCSTYRLYKYDEMAAPEEGKCPGVGTGPWCPTQGRVTRGCCPQVPPSLP